jgi:hypothetical protein
VAAVSAPSHDVAHSTKINLVNEVVIAIRVSLDAYRIELMKEIFVDAFTFEVARAVDRDLSLRIGLEFSYNSDQQRLVAVLLALKDSGLLRCQDHGRATWFCLGSKNSPAMQLDEVEELAKGNVEEASKFFISFVIKKSEMLRSIKLSKRCRLDLDEGVVESNWKKVGAIVKLIVKDRLQLVAAELEDGLIMEDLTRSTEDEIFYVWLSLGDKANKKPFMVDLEVFSPVDGGDQFDGR